jgi:hypothetical protein
MQPRRSARCASRPPPTTTFELADEARHMTQAGQGVHTGGCDFWDTLGLY